MKNRPMRQRFGFAWEGIAATWRNERSFRTQTLFALALPVALLLLRVSALWWALCLTIAFLVLATNREPAAQLVALLFMENALALFESLMPDPWPLPVHVAISSVYVGTVAVGSWLIRGQRAA